MGNNKNLHGHLFALMANVMWGLMSPIGKSALQEFSAISVTTFRIGCREVVMRWTDDYMNRERFLRADNSVFDVFPVWQAEMLNGYADEGAAFLNISACDPE